MTRSEAIADIQLNLGFRGDQSANIIIQLQKAQRLLELGTRLPWFLELDATLTGTGGDGTLALPTGFLREVDDEPWRVTTADGAVTKLRKVPYDQLQDLIVDPDTGDVEEGDALYYALRSLSIEVGPVPADNYSVIGRYYKSADDLGSTAGNNWLTYAPDVLVGQAGMLMAGPLRDPGAKVVFSEMFNAGKSALVREMAVREAENREYVMGNQA